MASKARKKAAAAAAAELPAPETGVDTFEEGEDVLGYHGSMLYLAKVLRVREEASPREYFVHYYKWSRRWDEWVTSERLMKASDSNRAYQKQLEKEARRKKRRAAAAAAAEEDAEGAGKRRRRAGSRAGAATAPAFEVPEGVEPAAEAAKRVEIKFNLPAGLKAKLVNDWEEVAKNHRLVPLPRQPTVRQLLNEFVESKARKPATVKVAEDVAAGLQVYFDRALPTVLLYRFERPQLARARAAAKDKGAQFVPSEVYGAEHLLRLFVKLPGLLAHSTLPVTQTQLLQKQLTDFIKWLQRNKTCFAGKYVEPDDLEAYLAEFAEEEENDRAERAARAEADAEMAAGDADELDEGV